MLVDLGRKGSRYIHDINSDPDHDFRFLDVTDLNTILKLFEILRPDYVIHLAALTGSAGGGGGAESVRAPYGFFEANIGGTLNVFEASRQLGIKKIIHMSSFSPYGITNEAINEETPFNPTNPYGASKAASESIAKCYAQVYGIKTVIFRAPLLCGETQRELNVLGEFVNCAKKKEPLVIFGKGEHLREFLHPSDVADAFLRAIDFMEERMIAPYDVFVLGNKPISMKDLAKLVTKTVDEENGKPEYRFLASEQEFDQYTDTRKVVSKLEWKAKVSVEEIVRRLAAGSFTGAPLT